MLKVLPVLLLCLCGLAGFSQTYSLDKDSLTLRVQPFTSHRRDSLQLCLVNRTVQTVYVKTNNTQPIAGAYRLLDKALLYIGDARRDAMGLNTHAPVVLTPLPAGDSLSFHCSIDRLTGSNTGFQPYNALQVELRYVKYPPDKAAALRTTEALFDSSSYHTRGVATIHLPGL